MPDLVRFDDVCVTLLIPRDVDNALAEAARVTLDEPAFLDSFRNTVRQFFAAFPALTVLTVTLEA